MQLNHPKINVKRKCQTEMSKGEVERRSRKEKTKGEDEGVVPLTLFSAISYTQSHSLLTSPGVAERLLVGAGDCVGLPWQAGADF